MTRLYMPISDSIRIKKKKKQRASSVLSNDLFPKTECDVKCLHTILKRDRMVLLFCLSTHTHTRTHHTHICRGPSLFFVNFLFSSLVFFFFFQFYLFLQHSCVAHFCFVHFEFLRVNDRNYAFHFGFCFYFFFFYFEMKPYYV